MIQQQEIGLTIKNICPGLPEIGKIKIGEKGHMITSKGGKQFQPPKKLDHFRVTTLERDTTGNYVIDQEIHDKIGEKPTMIAVRLLYDDPEVNFPTRLSCYDGTSLFCSGNNEIAYRGDKKIDCPCERIRPDFEGRGKCKYTGVLSAILDTHQRVGGVWKFRTTSYNTVINILSSMAMIQRITGGKLSGIPLDLVLLPKTVTTPGTGKLQVIYVVGLEYQGSMLDLAKDSADAMVEQIENKERILKIEHRAKQIMVETGSLEENESIKDIIEEFYPEEVAISGDNVKTLMDKSIKAKITELKKEMKPDTTNERGEPGKYGHGDTIPQDDPKPETDWMTKQRLFMLARSNWIDKQKPGFSTFVYEHLEEIKKLKVANLPLYNEMMEKWHNFYPEPWPLDPAPIETTETAEQVPDKVEQEQQNSSTVTTRTIELDVEPQATYNKDLTEAKSTYHEWKAKSPEAWKAAHNNPGIHFLIDGIPEVEWGLKEYDKMNEELSVQFRGMNGEKF